jgi:pectate lyase
MLAAITTLACCSEGQQATEPTESSGAPAMSAAPNASGDSGGKSSEGSAGDASKPESDGISVGGRGAAGAAEMPAAGSGEGSAGGSSPGDVEVPSGAADAGARDAGMPVIDSGGCPIRLVGFATIEGGTTGGGSVPSTPVTTPDELRACAAATEPRVCLVQGTLTFPKFEEIDVESDKTILGQGASAEIVMGGFRLNTDDHNVIIRNLTIRDSFIEGQYDAGGDDGGDRDGIQLDTAHHVWIDHVHFRHLGDGMIDSRKDTTFLTVSWNIFADHNKTFGIGWTDNVTSQLTIHHNWIHDTVQRNPSTDNVLRAHLFNNLLENVESYGNYARGGTNMVLQNSVFIGVKDPHYYETGTLVATGNVYRGASGKQTSTGTTFSFFDPGMFYSYELDSPDDAESLVRRCAGPRAELGN